MTPMQIFIAVFAAGVIAILGGSFVVIIFGALLKSARAMFLVWLLSATIIFDVVLRMWGV